MPPPSSALPHNAPTAPAAGSKGPLSCIILVWAIVNTFFLLKNGIVTTGEADKYIRQTHFFLDNGHFVSPNYHFYFLIIGLLACCIKFHIGYWLIILIQWSLNLLATTLFFRTAARLADSPVAAFTVTILLLFNFPYQAFNSFLQTESLFHSLSLIFSCLLLQKDRLLPKHLPLVLAGIALLTITRPVGIFYLPAAALYFYFTTLKNAAWLPKTIFLLVLALGFIVGLDTAMNSGGELDFMLPFREEHIICGTPTLLLPAEIKVAGNGNSVYSLLYFVSHQPLQFLRLAGLKTLAFWGLYRPYYSTGHNTYLLTFFGSIMLAALFSIRTWFRSQSGPLLYLASLILLTWISVVMSCDDWHNRFFLTISPYLILLSAPGFKTLLTRKKRLLDEPVAERSH